MPSTRYLENTASPSPGLERIVGAACVGASVMLGRENGVMAQLKTKVHLIITHCLAYRLALAVSSAVCLTSWFELKYTVYFPAELSHS